MAFSDHQAAVQQAEMTRQSAVAGLQADAANYSYIRYNGVVYSTLQAAINAASIAFYRACLASALANNVTPAPYIEGLRNLGTGGA